MKIRVITIEREFGGGGARIAELLAERLGWRLWDQDLTREIAKQANVREETAELHDERPDPLLYRLAKVFARGSYERSLPLGDSRLFDTDAMVRMVTEVIQTAAESGNCVIVGRGAPFMLRQRPDAYHVFVYAPYEEKIRRLLEVGKSEAEAVHLLNTIDSERAAFVKQYTGRRWPDRYLYNMWINSLPGDQTVIDTILAGVAALEKSRP
jgi:cytidylate kinase